MDRNETLIGGITDERRGPLRVLIAPSGFKECLDAGEVAQAIAAGISKAAPDAIVTQAPLVDGGEGFSRSLAKLTGGALHPVEVSGPTGLRVDASFVMLGGAEIPTAALEIAAAAGLRLAPKDSRDPLVTTTRGVGELIKADLDAGARHLIIGCGDSGTNDGGMGLARALGARFLDALGEELGEGGGELVRLERIDVSRLDPRLAEVKIEVCCNWKNVLCGERGVARVFGPQKGASVGEVALLSRAMDRYAEIIRRDLGIDVSGIPGGGASGGAGAGLHAILGARLSPRYETMARFVDIDGMLVNKDLVIVAEGSLDDQTPHGKMPVEIARRAKKAGVPVFALAGMLGPNAGENYSHGIDAFESILREPCSQEIAIKMAAELLTEGAERAMRLILLGRGLRRESRGNHEGRKSR